MIGGALFIVAVAVIAIWIIIEVKRLKHKIFALFLIGIIIAVYLSALFVFSGQNVDLSTATGVLSAGKLYMSWLGTVFTNVKTITANAVGLDWNNEKTIEDVNVSKISIGSLVK